jgi:hypothetical protein
MPCAGDRTQLPPAGIGAASADALWDILDEFWKGNPAEYDE